MKKNDFLAGIILLIIALLFVADLYFHPGRSVTYDGHVHITSIAQFYLAIKDGDFPVSWTNGFASFGYPLGFVAHQFPIYLGAFLQLFTQNPVLAYNSVALIGVWLTLIFWYKFLRYYYSELISLSATILLALAPYRIVNLYARGALPELFASVFIPITLIGLYLWLKKFDKKGLIYIMLGIFGFLITHPMTLIVASVFFIPYALLISWPWKDKFHKFILIFFSIMIGFFMSSYYFINLFYSMRFFYYGQHQSQFRGGFQELYSFFSESWTYFALNHAGPRPQLLTFGYIEISILLIGLLVFFLRLIQKKNINREIFASFIAFLAILFFLHPISKFLYDQLFFLGAVQYPWRFLSIFVFLPSLIFAWLMSLLSKKKQLFFIITVLFLIFVLRFPQLYGKNYLIYDFSAYEYTTANLHTNTMNTIWSGPSDEYPPRDVQAKILEGDGQLAIIEQKNSSRKYRILAESSIKLVDYTYYFPGWIVLANGKEIPIEFQNPNFRGLITYQLEPGEYLVEVKFTPTKAVLLFRIISILGLLLFVLLCLWIFNEQFLINIKSKTKMFFDKHQADR